MKNSVNLYLSILLVCICLIGCQKPEPEPQFMGEECIQFEDENFKAYCLKNFDTDQDGEISAEEAWYATSMSVDPTVVASLGGIECFPNLMLFDCSLTASSTAKSKLTSLDLSSNTELRYMLCAGNQLTTLDVSKNTNLQRLSCERNQLTGLDLSKNAELKELFCSDNQLATLNVSNNANLEVLFCQRNKLTSLDVSVSTALTSLTCSENQLTTLDLSSNTELMWLSCTNNQISQIYVWNGFDESDCPDWYKDPSAQYVVK